MTKREVFFTKEQSMALRGIGAVMVVLSHYASWYGDVIGNGILQEALMRFGVYGVDIFFLLSGYGLAKSARVKPVSGRFFRNRLKNTWLVYLLIAGIIAVCGEGVHTLRGWVNFLTGKDYWFIRNILVFYLLFFAVYAILPINADTLCKPASFIGRQAGDGRHPDSGTGENDRKENGKRLLRVLLLACGVLGYSAWLVQAGYGYFWYVSNITFWMGVVAAEYEKELLSAADVHFWLQMLVLAVLVFWVIRTGLEKRLAVLELSVKIRDGVLASVIWALFVQQGAGLLSGRLPLLSFLGKLSLELYLWHVFVYLEVSAYMDGASALQGVFGSGVLFRLLEGALALVLSVLLAWGTHELVMRICGRLETRSGRKKAAG